MGCGRSTLGSDSPKKSKKKEADGDDSDSESGGGGRKQNQQLINKFVPFGAGGPLLAQAKVSDSQHDFFMMLDEKIDNGADYDSETEEMDRRRRLHEYADQWTILTKGRVFTPVNTTMLRFPDDDASGSGDLTEDEDDEEDGLSEPERIPDEAVREQYMFMGNLYTLTHIRTDSDKTEPVVDVVSTAPDTIPEEDLIEHIGGNHKLNGSAGIDAEKAELEVMVVEGEEGSDSKSSSRPSSRPASLILRSVFPSETAQD